MSDHAEWMARESREGIQSEPPKRTAPWFFWFAALALIGAYAWDLRVGLGVSAFLVFERLAEVQEAMARSTHEDRLRWVAVEELVNRVKSIQFAVNPESRKSID